MGQSRTNQDIVGVMLKAVDGAEWRLTLSRDCLRFVGRYPRISGFAADPAKPFEAFIRPT